MTEQENKNTLPNSIKDSKQIKTTVRTMASVIKEKLMQLNDLATLEIMLDSSVRMKKRLASIKKMSSAESLKIRGHWKTIAPEMHITGLMGKKINNDEYEIFFNVFEMDKKGNKKLHTHYTEVELRDGSKIRRAISAEYHIAFEVTEKIRTNKPITREVVKIDLTGGQEQ